MTAEEARNSAYQLAGSLLNSFSHLEYDLSWAILRIYGLDWAKGCILTNNMSFGAKNSALRTAVELFSEGYMTDEWRAEADKIFDDVNAAIMSRNMVAHTYFEANDSGDLCFVKVKTNKRFSEVEIKKTPSAVKIECGLISDLSYYVGQLVAELTRKEDQYLPPRVPNGKLNPQTSLYLAGYPRHSEDNPILPE